MNDRPAYIELNFSNMPKEDKKELNKKFYELADRWGYALKYSEHSYAFQIGTREELQKTIDFFAKQDAICGNRSAERLVVVPVSELHHSTKRRLVQSRLETTLNDRYAQGDPEIVKMIEDKRL